MKFGQLIEYSMRNIFVENHAEHESGRLVPYLFLDFEKALFEAKVSGLHLIIFQ